MYKCLLVDEILREIFSRLEWPDLRHVLHTCKAFKDPALDALWAMQGSVHALVALLPQELIQPGYDIPYLLPLPPATHSAVMYDAEVRSRATEYNSWVQAAPRYSSVNAEIETDPIMYPTMAPSGLLIDGEYDDGSFVASALADPPRDSVLCRPANLGDLGALFRRCRRLIRVIYDPEHRKDLAVLEDLADQFPDIDLFPALREAILIVPNFSKTYHSPRHLLSKVSRIIISPTWTSEVYDVGRCLRSAQYDAPLLRHIGIECGKWSYEMLVHLLQHKPALESVALPTHEHITLWVALAAMPNLYDLKITHDHTRATTSPVLERCTRKFTFSTLTSLTVSCRMGRAFPLLARCDFPVLLYIRCLGQFGSGLYSRKIEFGQLFRAIGKKAPALRSISIEGLPYGVISGHNLAELSRCTQLEHVHISPCGNATFELDNVATYHMAKAWPSLRHLFLDPKASPLSKVTLEGLVPFARFCPSLVELHIGVDPHAIHVVYAPELYTTELGVVPSKLQHLNVSVPSVHDTVAAAEFFTKIFPSIRSVAAPCTPSKGGEMFAWNKVVKLVREHIRPRELSSTTGKGNCSRPAADLEEYNDDDADYYYDPGWEDAEGSDAEGWDEAKLHKALMDAEDKSA